MSIAQLPALNATLNATCAGLLVLAWWCIRHGKVGAHAALMVAALAVSAAFLASYLIYHAQVGSVAFPGLGWIRPVYFTMLITHTVLAVIIVPLVLRTVVLAGQKRFEMHRRIARWTLPLWLYVSVSGVTVYWLLYESPWGV
jgi:uncharacterized membrane protein YozB (DUF420 family)